MSALSNQQVTHEETFNALEYVKSLCINTKLTVTDFSTIQFLPGWKSIVEDLIKAIKGYPNKITQMTDCHSILEVKFNVLKPTKEIIVWRAIERAREESQLTCAQCGDRIRYRRNLSADIFCDACIKNAGLFGKTGTWLDGY